MRLPRVATGHRLPVRLKLALMRRMMGGEVGLPLVLLYRPDLFGRSFVAAQSQVMTGPSEWSRGDRELFAAFVSRLNSCNFCATAHGEFAVHVGGREEVGAILADWRTAPSPPRMRAMLGFLEKLTIQPGDISPADTIPLRAAGVSAEAAVDAVNVCAQFCVVNRVVDALGIESPPAERWARMAPMALRRGYRM